MRKVQFLMFFSWFLGVRARSVPAFFWLILGFLLTIFVSFFVLFDKNLLFLIDFRGYEFVLSQLRHIYTTTLKQNLTFIQYYWTYFLHIILKKLCLIILIKLYFSGGLDTRSKKVGRARAGILSPMNASNRDFKCTYNYERIMWYVIIQ